MQICIPVLDDRGLESNVCAHFGSAPQFMLVDTVSGACRAIPNRNSHHAHGMCQPLAALAGEVVEGMVVGGIGMGALSRLQAANIAVYRATHRTVGETVAAYNSGTLELVDPATACAHHGSGHGASTPGPDGSHNR